jgi:hypothetical protein
MQMSFYSYKANQDHMVVRFGTSEVGESYNVLFKGKKGVEH